MMSKLLTVNIVVIFLLIFTEFSQQHDISRIKGRFLTDPPELDRISLAAIHVLRSCFLKRLRGTLLLAGQYQRILEDYRGLFENLPVALIDGSERNAFTDYTLSRYSYFLRRTVNFARLICRLHHFVVVARSQPMLRLTLQRIKDTTWANSEGFYILIDSGTNRGCVNAMPFLWAAWEYDLTFAVFLCEHPTEGLLLYTYNPYNEERPEPWREEFRIISRNKHFWILLKRPYMFDSSICEHLYFEKTRTLNGYEIRMDAIEMAPVVQIDDTKTGMDRFSGECGDMIRTLWTVLNASVIVTEMNGTTYSLSGISPNGTLTGMLANVAMARLDMSMNARLFTTTWDVRYTYPHGDSGICVFTRPPGFVSELEKLLSFLSPQLIAIMLVLGVVSHVIVSRQEGFIRATLDIVRLSVCVSVVYFPRSSSVRLYFFTVFVFFMIVNTIFQAQWQSVLTVPMQIRGIQTIEDLKREGYTVYGVGILQQILGDEQLLAHYKVVEYDECKELVLNSSKAACAANCQHLLYRIKDEDLQGSKKIRELAYSFVTRRNWPLFHRVNGVIQSMVEAGLMTMWRQKSLRTLHLKTKKKKKKQGYSVVVLNQLAFIFYFLIAGQTIALIVFISEIFVHRVKSNEDNKIRSDTIEEDKVLYPWTP